MVLAVGLSLEKKTMPAWDGAGSINIPVLWIWGVVFKKEYWDQGYATEAAIACMHYSFEIQGITEILGRVVHGNDAPVSVLKKLGMSFWKTEHCHGMVADYFRINNKFSS